MLIRDGAAFSALWGARIGGNTPRIDFTRYQVVVAFEAASSGKTVSVAKVTGLEDDELAVTIHTRLSFAGGSGAAPYSLVTVPLTTGPVSFETIDVTPRP